MRSPRWPAAPGRSRRRRPQITLLVRDDEAHAREVQQAAIGRRQLRAGGCPASSRTRGTAPAAGRIALQRQEAAVFRRPRAGDRGVRGWATAPRPAWSRTMRSTASGSRRSDCRSRSSARSPRSKRMSERLSRSRPREAAPRCSSAAGAVRSEVAMKRWPACRAGRLARAGVRRYIERPAAPGRNGAAAGPSAASSSSALHVATSRSEKPVAAAAAIRHRRRRWPHLQDAPPRPPTRRGRSWPR